MTGRERDLLLQTQRLREQIRALELELEKFRRGQMLVESMPEEDRVDFWRSFQDLEDLVAERDEARSGEWPIMVLGSCPICGSRSEDSSAPHTWRACAEGLAKRLKERHLHAVEEPSDD